MRRDSSLVSRPFAGSASPQLVPDRSNGLALGEGAFLLVGLTLLDYVGAISFTDWPVHPFLFAVVLLSAQYGIHGGILAAVGAIGLSHIDGWPSRPIDMSYAAYFGYVWADALSWVLAGLMVGAVTSNRVRVMQEQAAKLHKAMLAENLIAAQYEVLAQRTHQLERQLANHTDAGNASASAEAVVRPRPKSHKSPRQTPGQSDARL